MVALHARRHRAGRERPRRSARRSSSGCSSATRRGCRSSTGRPTRCGGSPARFRLALASSSNRPLIDVVLEASGLAAYFEATVSSEEVARGKPAPDVFLEAARRLGVDAERVRGDRGLWERHPGRARRGDARRRDPEPPLPAARGRARARGRRPRLDPRPGRRGGLQVAHLDAAHVPGYRQSVRGVVGCQAVR